MLNGNQISCVFLGLVFGVAGIVGWCVDWQEYQVWAFLEEQGQATEARIVKLHRIKGSRDPSRNYRADYNFEAAGQSYTRTSEVCHDLYKALQVGVSVRVRYDPDNPNRSRLFQSCPTCTSCFPDGPNKARLVLSALAACGGCVLGGWGLLHYRSTHVSQSVRKARYRKYGRRAKANE